MGSLNNREQVRVFAELDAHINVAIGMEWFRSPIIKSRKEGESEKVKVEPVRSNCGLVHRKREQVVNKSANKSTEEGASTSKPTH